MKPPALVKSDKRLPDNYGLTIYYHDGTRDELEVAHHMILDKVIVDDRGRPQVVGPAAELRLELVTKEDRWMIVPLAAVKKIEFDGRFSNMVALKQREAP